MSEIENIRRYISGNRDYNLHTHTQFCDGHSSMREMMESACDSGFAMIGFSPHAPVSIESPCNMDKRDVEKYLDEISRLREDFPESRVLAGMEVDFINEGEGPHIDYYHRLPLDYRIGSVHFVPTRDGVPVDCDGNEGRFQKNLKEAFAGDLRYVVETFLTNTLIMIERGGFDILGHFDKIAANASSVDARIEKYPWYQALIDDIVRNAAYSGLIIEINTKALEDKKRFFPSEHLFAKVLASGADIAVNSDAHHAARLNSGRSQAFELLDNIKN